MNTNTKPLVLSCITLAAALAATPVMADSDFNPTVKLSGFGTVGAARTNNDRAQFRSSQSQKKGADTNPDIGVDSNLGLQADVRFNDTFSAVGQLLEARRGTNDAPKVEWLFGQAKVTSWLDVRIGRTVLPLYMVSDYKSVGYAQFWLRAPTEVYGATPFTYVDGAQAIFRQSFGDTKFSLQPTIGKGKGTLWFSGSVPVKLDASSIRGITGSAERGDWTLRGSITRSDSEATIVGAPPGVSPTSYITDTFSNVGVQYDDGTWIVVSEFIKRKQNPNNSDSTGFYVSGARRFGSLTPYLIYSEFKPTGVRYAYKETTNTVAAGLRWDAVQNVAIKAQFERTQPQGQFVNTTPSFDQTHPNVNVLSLAVNFVF